MKKSFIIITILTLVIILAFVYRTNKKIVIEPEVKDTPAQFLEKSLFLSPIKTSSFKKSEKLVTGITVPHHLLASDIIASGFIYASGVEPENIVLISPDHFNVGKTNVTVSSSGFLTVFGKVNSNTKIAENLKKLDFVKEQDFFYREHGLGAELPFINYFFPNSKITAITFKISSSKKELDKVLEVLENSLKGNSLIVQSTDFSHYLIPENAETKDKETINILKSGEVEKLFSLKQPQNMDCISCQYVQMRLQKDFFNSSLNILEHKNSQSYTNEKVDSSTSYILQAWEK